MTGAAWVRGPTPVGELTVAIRSVNGRTLSVKTRLPPECQGYDRDIERLVRARLTRGSVVVTLGIELPAPGGEPQIDDERFAALAARLSDLTVRHRLPPVTVADVLAIPGVLVSAAARSTAPFELPEEIARLVGSALDSLRAERAVEGAGTVRAMAELIDRLESDRTEVAARAPLVIDEHRRRLIERVNEFLDGRARQLEPEDVIRELGLFADRVDVGEELQRLGMHVERLRATLEAGGEVGRGLEFLLQEVLREINTIGSKSPDVEIAHRVVAMKSAVDKLKELAANLE